MAVKSKLGRRVPITFLRGQFDQQEGGAHDEAYSLELNTFANVEMRNSMRNITDGQLQMTTIYVFSGIRAFTGFEPNKAMLIEYKGVRLVIDSIVLNENKLPYYYTITALTNG